jgi:type IV pilus assembly protein PilY1
MRRIVLFALWLELLPVSWVFAASNPEVRIAAAPSCNPFGVFGGMVPALAGLAMSHEKTMMFQAGFDMSTSAGSLRKISFSNAGGLAAHASYMNEWDAGLILTGAKGVNGQPDMAPNPLPEARRIYTGRAGVDKSFSTIEFTWDQLSDSQKNALNISPSTKKGDGLGAKRVSYLRGDRTLELGKPGGMFRERFRVLGDIVNSKPVYYGEPSRRVQGDGYQGFYEQYRNRTRAVYVGANDGMLHAFNAEDGRELFAYIPNALIPDLPVLTSPSYQHRPYVDGGIDVSEAMAGGKWMTVLAAGMGGGAQGVFALDVTQPSSFGSGAGALFEFTDADDPDMGNLMGVPLIAKFRTQSKGGTIEYRYFVVVSAGLNNYRDDGKGRFNKDGAGALFLLSLDKSPSEQWKLGTNYFKFRIPSKDPALPNGLAAPALVIGATGAVRYAYAGDLQGNLWRFDFTGDLPWKGALASDTPLFVAKDEKGNRQPITMQAKVVFAPGGGYVVLFGTGKYLEESDGAPIGFRSQSFYGILDTTESKYRVAGRSELVPRIFAASGKDLLDVTGPGFEYGSGDKDKKGWYVDFPESVRTGERAVTDLQLADGMLHFHTLIPGSSFCPLAGGRSYALNVLTGLTVSNGSVWHAGMPWATRPPMLLPTLIQVGDRNPIGRRAVRKTYSIVDPLAGSDKANDVSGGVRNDAMEVVLPAGRLSWREIVNWQELKHASNKK